MTPSLAVAAPVQVVAVLAAVGAAAVALAASDPRRRAYAVLAAPVLSVLAVATIVDDAVGDVDTIAARLRAGAHGEPAWKRIVDASLEMRGALGYAMLVAVAAAIPAFFLAGQPGEFAPDLVAAYLLAIAATLRRISHTLGLVTFGVRAIERQTEPIGPTLKEVNRRLEQVAESVEQAEQARTPT
jgi:Cu/Ag efflux pump CusA